MFGSIPGSPFFELFLVPGAIPLQSLQWRRNFDPSFESSACGRGQIQMVPYRVSVVNGGKLSCCSWAKSAKFNVPL